MMFQVTGLVKLVSISSRRTLLSQAFAGEVDPVGVVDYSIEDHQTFGVGSQEAAGILQFGAVGRRTQIEID
jgi:hypothetical protein